MTIYGADYLGGCNFRKAMVANHPQGWAAGIFLRTFGDARKTVEAMVKSGKFSQIVVHLAPFRNDHSYPKQLTPQMKQDAKWLWQLQGTTNSTKLLCSPYCESNGTSPNVFKQLKEFFPGPLVNSILPKAPEHPDTITEIHIPNTNQLPKIPQRPYLVSFDGCGGKGEGNYTDVNIEAILKRYSDAIHIRWWNFRMNGKFGWKDTTPVNQRKHWPNGDYLQNGHSMMKMREGAITWPHNALYKPQADDHGSGGKDNKALVILPKQKPELLVRDISGNVIDRMRHYEPHDGEPKGERYYSQKWSYQIAQAAYKKTGSTLIKIDDMPLTDGNLRSGLFR